MYVNDYIKKCKSYLGTKEGGARHKLIVDAYNTIKPLPQGYKVKYSDSWCACFVSAMAWLVSGGTDTDFPYECSCNRMIEISKNKKIWVENESVAPSVGWLVLYDWDDNGSGDNQGSSEHVGVIYKVNKKTFEVIEGNKSDSVSTRKINIDGKYIRGFIAVKYDTVTPLGKKSIKEVAQEVIKGLWGNGEARKKKLEASGYDYYKVQKKVNELLGK